MIRAWALVGDTVLCSWATHWLLQCLAPRQVYKWVSSGNAKLVGNPAIDYNNYLIPSEAGIGHVRYINILAWLRGFRVKIAIFSSFFCLSIPKRDLDTKKTTPNIEFWPESLGAMLEYWYIERGLLEMLSSWLMNMQTLPWFISAIIAYRHLYNLRTPLCITARQLAWCLYDTGTSIYNTDTHLWPFAIHIKEVPNCIQNCTN